MVGQGIARVTAQPFASVLRVPMKAVLLMLPATLRAIHSRELLPHRVLDC